MLTLTLNRHTLPFSRAFSLAVLASLSCGGLLAQEAPAANIADDGSKKQALVLTPFQVNSSRDVGFVATSSLAGGRLASDLRDTPAAYSVLTREFIDALNIKDLKEATRWSVNTNQTIDNGSSLMQGNDLPGRATIRGISVNQPQIDFFPVYHEYDSYNLERFDFARGPNSVLFGNGSLGGTPNANLKQARVNTSIEELRVSVGSWENYRGTLDINKGIGKQVAVRVNALWQDGQTWRDREYDKRIAASLAVTYQPWRGGEFRASAEKGRFDRNIAISTIADNLSGWDGTTVFSGVQPVATLPANANAVGVSRVGSSNVPYYIYSAGLGGIVYNMANTANTQGGNVNSSVPIGGALVAGTVGNFSGQSILEALNRPANAFDRAIAGSQFKIPGRRDNATWDSSTFLQKYQVYNAAFNQQIGDHYFFEVAVNGLRSQKNTDYGPTRGLSTLRIDINRNLPNGAPNPEFLQPYYEIILNPYVLIDETRNIRTGLAAVFDRTRFGDFRLNLLAGRNERERDQTQLITSVLNDPDARKWTSNPVRIRQYVDQPSRPLPPLGGIQVVDPVLGTRTLPVGNVLTLANLGFANYSREKFDYLQLAGTAKLFKNRLILLGAVRRDVYSSRNKTVISPGDFPAGWDGISKFYRPAAPANYKTLTYTPKDANGVATGASRVADVRPRDVNGLRLPQYANDRFQDDYGTPFSEGGKTTYSMGSVYHVKPWVSLIANYAQTYNLRFSRTRIDGSDFAPFLSSGWDAGLRFTLFDGKFVATATTYKGKEVNVGVVPGPSAGLQTDVTAAINNIANANVIGDFSTDGRNIRGLVNTPINYGDLATRKASGYELDMTANLTKQWRLLANVAFPEATLNDAYSDTRTFLATNDALMRQVLADTGALISSTGVATINTSIPINQRSPDLNAAVTAWNGLQATLANLVTGSQLVPRLSKITANLFTDYTIANGPLKGLRFGGGVNYRSKQVIGFKGGDTIRDPANSTQAIDDPSVSGYSPVYGNAYYTTTAVFGYNWKLRGGKELKFDLTINNVLDNGDVQYYNTVLRPPGGDVTNPARVATPNNYSYLDPRSYSLSATLKF